jgi:hypothetical protein
MGEEQAERLYWQATPDSEPVEIGVALPSRRETFESVEMVHLDDLIRPQISDEDQALIRAEAARNCHKPNHEIPVAITRVDGCDCGGTEWHRAAANGQPACTLYGLAPFEIEARIAAANKRAIAYTDELNRKLREAWKP